MMCARCSGRLDVNPVIQVREGTHRKTICSLCGQLHEWDQPVDHKNHSGKIRTGPPRECTHADKKQEAKIPWVSREG